ncbi:MAG: hypothetical protein KGO52_14955 [Nitrospirota bacterium]|nr:hypothetical protein [Nitrospirota bacterium]MDE3225555.1 hypothetical protein [Nitrospirota bacterium]MDE3244008.1 hypothetical protein [Nitrospirota bacterium]
MASHRIKGQVLRAHNLIRRYGQATLYEKLRQPAEGLAGLSERERVRERRVPAHPLFFTRMERMRAEVRGVAEPACREP